MPPFQYSPYRSPYVGTISELMMEPGRAQAQAALQSGQAWGQAAGQIGQIAGAVPQQIQQQKMQALQAQGLQQSVDRGARDAADMKALDAAYQRPGGRDAIINALPGHLRPLVQKQFTEADEAAAKVQETALKVAESQNEYFGGLAANIRDHGYDPMATQIAISHAKQTYANNPEMLKQIGGLEQVFQNDPTKIQSVVDQLIAVSPKQQAADSAALTAKSRAAQAETGAARLSLETPKIAAETQRVQQEVTGTQPMSPAQTASNAVAQGNLAVARGRLSVEQQKAAQTQGDVTELTPEGLDAAALNYAKTGNLPPLGMGDKTTRKQIINRAAAMMPGLDVASAKADFDANKASLSKIQTQRDAISAFEKTATKNIDIFLNAAGKVVDTGSPLANSLARSVNGKMLGSPDQAAYDAARLVAINEIAKITSNPNLSGTLSDSARQEVEAFNPKSATLKQTVAVMRLLKQDMANRASAMDDQIAGIQTRIKQGQSTTTPPSAPLPPPGMPSYQDYLRSKGGK